MGTDRLVALGATLVLGGTVVLGAAGCGVAGPATVRPGQGRGSHGRLSNESVARSEAQRLFDAVHVPAGATTSATSPVPSEQQPPSTPGTPDLVDRHGWWTVAMSPAATLAWLGQHPPDGLKQSGGGSSGGNGPRVDDVTYDAAPRPGIDSAEVLETVTSDGHGGSAIRADAQVAWLPEHAAAETIPPNTERLTLTATEGVAPSRTLGHRVVTGARAHRLVHLIDALPTAARGEHGCGADFGYTLTVVAGPLTFRDDVACYEIAVTDDGQALPALASSDAFVRTVAADLGIPAYPKPPTGRGSPAPG
jgi:hypothetical protein